MRISKFGQKITATSGIGRLMDDLAIALSAGPVILMLGGGNIALTDGSQTRSRRQLNVESRSERAH